jgi:uncharacterized membrane protein YfcA
VTGGAGALLPSTGVGLVGGALVGLTGVGAGSVIAALLLVLYPEVRPQIIVGSATIQAVAMKLVGVWVRRRFQLTVRGLGIAMAAGAIPLAVAGALASSKLSGSALRPIVSFVLIVVGAHLAVQAAHARWKRASIGENGVDESKGPSGMDGANRGAGSSGPAGADPKPATVGLLGAGVGFIAGLTSIGTGTLFVSVLAGPLRIAVHRAVGAALLAGLLTLIVSGATHAALGHLDGALVAGTCLGSIPGVLIGTALSNQLRAPALRGIVGAGIMVAALIAIARGKG